HIRYLAPLSFLLQPLTQLHHHSLHDALPISASKPLIPGRRTSITDTSGRCSRASAVTSSPRSHSATTVMSGARVRTLARAWRRRSEEHTSELQSRFDLVCRLLLEKTTQSLEP